MRLIDAEKLRKQFIALYSNRECLTEKDSVLVECVDLIDNAPTVELTETEIQEVLNKRCMTAVANEYLIALHGKRPEGKWIRQYGKSYKLITTDEGTLIGEFTKCPKCLYDKARGSNFCPNCGTKMR